MKGGLTLKQYYTKKEHGDIVIALAGNPNVGKSTIFNSLTGMRQHTGNWAGKTVTNACGFCSHDDNQFILLDLPGCYSLMAHSAEEEVARDFLLFGAPDIVCVVCDATCLERNLNLVYQTLEICSRVIVCVNLMDEAKRKGIKVDLKLLSQKLGVPVVGTNARNSKGVTEILKAAADLHIKKDFAIDYGKPLSTAIEKITPALEAYKNKIPLPWLAIQLLQNDKNLLNSVNKHLQTDLLADKAIKNAVEEARAYFSENESIEDSIVTSIIRMCENTAQEVVRDKYPIKRERLDEILTSRLFGYPIMLALLVFIFWLTITGSNYPSTLLSQGFFFIEEKLLSLCQSLGIAGFVTDMLILGMYRVLAWVVSVMLPPMAIFFPLFTFLEDLGYLPRIAFNLDSCFKSCGACGKQALTTCMGFGCNAVGVTGARIIDSPRERLIAIITNSLVPCNGRFPTLIAVMTMFFLTAVYGASARLLSAVGLAALIVLGIAATFAASFFLSKTLLKGEASTFTIELPPYRRPQVGKIIVRSVFDRTLFVLGRAAVIAAPAGILIFLLANLNIGGVSLLAHISAFLDPAARLFGLDGVILLAFILGMPANEIVVPIMIMCYTAAGSLTDMSNLSQLHTLFVNNGWTAVTAICVMVFCVLHWPCTTTLMTIKKETQSLKWTVLSFALPTVLGLLCCFIINAVSALF